MGLIEINIETQLTRIERLAIIQKQIEEAESHGHGSITITFHNGQINNSCLNKDVRFGNTSPVWYVSA